MSIEDGDRLVIELQGIDKRHLAFVWEKMKAGQQLVGQEIFIGRSMADHPQWFPFFDTIGILEGGDETLPSGENPFGHVSLHVLVGAQIFNKAPEEADTFYRMRLRKGDEPHAIIHMLIEVFQRHIFWAARNRAPGGEMDLDLKAYGDTLRALWHLKTPKVWARLGFATPPRPHADEVGPR